MEGKSIGGGPANWETEEEKNNKKKEENHEEWRGGLLDVREHGLGEGRWRKRREKREERGKKKIIINIYIYII